VEGAGQAIVQPVRSTKRETLAGEEGFEPSYVGIKIRCLNQLGDSPTQVWLHLLPNVFRLQIPLQPCKQLCCSEPCIICSFLLLNQLLSEFFASFPSRSPGARSACCRGSPAGQIAWVRVEKIENRMMTQKVGFLDHPSHFLCEMWQLPDKRGVGVARPFVPGEHGAA
jgi:hypothetical protein